MKELDVADTDGADSVAVVGQFQMKKSIFCSGLWVALLPVLDRHFEGDFNRRRPIVGIKYPLQTFRRDLNQGLSESDRRWIGQSEQRGVRNVAELLLDGSVERRMTVPMEIDPDGRDRIEIPL